MKPIAILSVDTNPAYLSCIPIVCKSWELQGFDVHVRIVHKNTVNCEPIDAVIRYIKTVPIEIEGNLFNEVNPSLFTQCIRLYDAGGFEDDRYVIISDADMFIASSFLYRDFDKVNSFGHDLTGYGEIPMCYVGMIAGKWRQIMGGWGMLSDLIEYSKYQSSDWYECWGSDQQILTAKLKAYGFNKINFINRGNDNRNAGLPIGRWDRFNLKKPEGEIHDIHLMRNPLSDENFPLLVEMCETCYPVQSWAWLTDYRKEFNKAL